MIGLSMRSPALPAIWFPTIRTGTGSDVFTERLAAGLRERGLRAEITWLPPRAEYAPWTVAVPAMPASATVCHINSWLPRRFVPRGVPTVVTVHHLVHDPAFRPFRSVAQAAYHNLIIRRRELRNIRLASAVTTVSAYVKQTVEAFSGRAGIEVVPNWVEDRFTPAQPSGDATRGPFRLFMAGSPSRRKGIDLLPRFAEMLGQGFEIRYAGSSKPIAPLGSGIIEIGRVTDEAMLREYQGCDAVVSLSRYEGFGYTALEAISCGKPFLGFSTSGLSEVVDDGCARLVGNGDLAGLVQACRVLASDGVLLRALSGHARTRAANFSTRSAVASYVSIYREVVAARQPEDGRLAVHGDEP